MHGQGVEIRVTGRGLGDFRDEDGETDDWDGGDFAGGRVGGADGKMGVGRGRGAKRRRRE